MASLTYSYLTLYINAGAMNTLYFSFVLHGGNEVSELWQQSATIWRDTSDGLKIEVASKFRDSHSLTTSNVSVNKIKHVDDYEVRLTDCGS